MTEHANKNQESKIKRICRLLLESQEKTIKEKDLLILVENDEGLFQEIIGEVYSRFEEIGYELIRTSFMDEAYYLLASSGMDKNLTPQMYGILGLIFSFQKEFSRDISLPEAKEIFTSQWQEISFLQEKGYLQEHTLQKETYLLITPIGKVIFKDIISNIALDVILDDLGV
ncbi:MAG: hypothetical protein EU530_02460 [Promethearchaeota archaeon]|nr:MAG: hypothetical protein EU530_02460 [Candidatus Lokiarchaeota archaeon]